MKRTQLNYRPDIDGLRAVAVIAVVLHHIFPKLVPGGFVGVDVFFVISGFLITRILIQELGAGTFSFAKFYERRIRRLFPALFAMLATTLVAGWFLLLPSDYLATFRTALATVFFSSNVVFWNTNAAGYFAADAKLNPLLHTWSLGVEEQFYLIFPLLLLICVRYARRLLLPALFAVAALSLLASIVWVKDHPVAIFFLSPFRAWELIAGSLLALNAFPAVLSRASREAVSILGMAAVVGPVMLYEQTTTFPGLAALPPVLGTLAILHAGAGADTWVGRLLRLRPIVYVGLISYSLYLWHWPLIVLTRNSIGMAPVGPYWPAVLGGSLLLAALSYRYIEQPFRHGRSESRMKVFVYSGAAAAILILASAVGYGHRGAPQRFGPRTISFEQARNLSAPFQECDSSIGFCVIGARRVLPSVLLWGDSHMHALAPAFADILARQGRSALLAFTPTCPPLLEVRVTHAIRDCRKANNSVKTYLETHPSIESVVLAGWWTRYFQQGRSIVDECQTCAKSEDYPEVASLNRTMSWLEGLNLNVTVIRQVPTYDRSVPDALALEYIGWGRFPVIDIDAHRQFESPFGSVIEKFKSDRVQLIDPSVWLCQPNCAVKSGEKILYRDRDHLSAVGAMEYVPILESQAKFLRRSAASESIRASNIGLDQKKPVPTSFWSGNR